MSNNELYINVKWNVIKVLFFIRYINEFNNIFVFFLGVFFVRESVYVVF